MEDEVQPDAGSELTCEANVSLILKELREFRKDSGQQLKGIRDDINKIYRRVDEAEERINTAEIRIQSSEDVLSELLKLQVQMDAKLTDLKKGFEFQGRRVTLDHDYAPELIRKRNEYAEAKTALKERGIRFQTPFPARLRVFYKLGTVIYNSVKEATADMAERGTPVTVLKSPKSLLDQIHQLTW
ncbi:hypothetical protein SRHO_G00169680 [Serrasalmus rhombeus]